MTGIFLSNCCPCGSCGVPKDRPYCDDCLATLPASISDVFGGEAA